MSGVVAWLQDIPVVKRALQERTLDQIQPITTPVADPTKQEMVDQYNAELAEVQESKQAALQPDGSKILSRDGGRTILKPDGSIDVRSKSFSCFNRAFTLTPRPDGSIKYYRSSEIRSLEDGDSSSQEEGELTQIDDRLVDPNAFRVDARVTHLPAAADDQARNLLGVYRDALIATLTSGVGHYTWTLPGQGEISKTTTSNAQAKVLSFDKQDPSHSVGSYTLQHDGTMRINTTTWSGWGTDHENRAEYVFTPRADGSVECTHRTSDMSQLTRPAPIVSSGLTVHPQERFLITADGHSQKLED